MYFHHSSYKRRLEIFPSFCIDIVPYFCTKTQKNRTGIILIFAWLTEEIMLEFP